MRILRRLLARTLLSPLLLLPPLSCGRPSMPRDEAAQVIQSSPTFKSAKLAYLPRVLAIPADGIGSSAASREGEALNLLQIASIDPVVAILRARGEIEIEDFVSAVASSVVKPASPPEPRAPSPSDSTRDTTKAPPKQQSAAITEPTTAAPPAPPLAQAWVHTLRITPNDKLDRTELATDDGDDDGSGPRPSYGGRAVGRTLGWVLSIGTREFVKVLEVGPRDAVMTKDTPPGSVAVDFLWRWRPTRAGTPFDAESAEFQSLPADIQQTAIRGGLTVDASNPHWSRATLARTPTGWRVAKVDWSYGDGKAPPKVTNP